MVIYRTHERKINVNRPFFRRRERERHLENADVDEQDNIKVHVKQIGYWSRFV